MEAVGVQPRRDMQAVRFIGVDEPLIETRVPVPQLRAGQSLVRVKAVAICGSDVHILQGHTPVGFTPITLGHEIAGDVTEIADDAGDVSVGDRVFINPIVGCGECDYCGAGETNFCPKRGLLGIRYDGGMAEYVAAPTRNLTVIPGHISHAEIAMIESAGTAFHALRVLNAKRDDTVLVVGAGGLGLQVVRLATALGLRVVSIDPDEAARERALATGAERVLSPDSASALLESGQYETLAAEMGSSFGFAHAVDCVGFESTVNLALGLLRPRGSLSIIGIGADGVRLPDPAIFVRRSLQVRGIYTYTDADIASVIELLITGKLRLIDSVTRMLPLSAGNEAFNIFTTAEPRPVRVVMEIGET